MQRLTTVHTFRYGPAADQEGDLHLPPTPRPAVVCLLHGGFWKQPYGRDQMTAVAADLASRGLAVWNLEYRRLGGAGGGWPGTLEDAAAGVAHLARLAGDGIELDLERVAVVGHSAGGHLAFRAAARPGSGAETGRVRVRVVVGLAPVLDLARAYERRVGGEAVAHLLGGPPAEHPERYRAASPSEMLPLGVRQLILHGTADDAVPIDLSRRYARAAAAAGDDVELEELPGVGHMDFLDASGQAHATLCRWLFARLGEP